MYDIDDLEDDYAWHCPSCECNRYHCLCDVVGKPLTKKETVELYLLAVTNIEEFNFYVEEQKTY